MDKKIEDYLTYSLFGMMITALIFTIFNNIKNPWLIIMLSALLFLSFTLRHVFDDNRLSSIDLLIIVELILIFIIGRLDQSSSYMIYFYCLGINILLSKGNGIGFAIFLLSYTVYGAGMFYRMDGQPLWSITLAIIYNILGFVASSILAAILKYLTVQNAELNRVMKELKLKTFEQQETYNRLLIANKELEQIAALKERNRMAREIHDTIGHRLTTAIVEMEAGKTIFEKKTEEALDKFLMAQGQIKKCLEDVRISVRTLKSEDIGDFVKAVIDLINDTERHTGVKIKYEIEPIKEKLSHKIIGTLYRTIQEGITNGIRHGESTVFVLTLNSVGNKINLTLQDNGKGCSCIIKGFGLRSMEERVAEVKGHMTIESEEDEGFTINVQIPFG